MSAFQDQTPTSDSPSRLAASAHADSTTSVPSGQRNGKVALHAFGAFALLSTLLVLGAVTAKAYSSIRVADTGSAAFGTEVRWNPAATGRTNIANGRILYKIGAAGTNTATTGPGDAVSEVQRAFQAWAQVDGLALDFDFDGTATNPTENGNDDINNVFWSTGGFGPGELAVTTTTFDTATGEILDADLVFNDDFVWDTISDATNTGTAGRTYIRSVGIHEIGHFLGLDHSFHGAATLFPFTDEGAISPITLEHDDVSGLIKDHPSTSVLAPNRNGTVSGRVLNVGSGVHGVMVSLVNIATGAPVVSALSQKAHGTTLAGEYKIANVPSGNYWVFATPILPGELGAYYAGSFTAFQPAVLGVATSTTGAPTILRVKPLEDVIGIDFNLVQADPFASANSIATAQPITVGHALSAKISDQNDVDFYSFVAQAGEQITIHVHADGQGSDLNPFFYVYDQMVTARVLSGDFNDSGQSFYVATARDIEPNAFGRAALNFDARAIFTAPHAGTFHLVVDGSAFTSGFYTVTTHSNLTRASVDRTATRLVPALPSIAINGTMNIGVQPRNAGGVALPTTNSYTIELFDVTGGGMVSVGMSSGPGPWSFAITAPAIGGTRRYQAMIDALMMDQVLALDVYGAVDATASIIETVDSSLVADGVSTTLVRVGLFDAANQRVSDTGQIVMITTTAGTVRAGAASGMTVPASFNTLTGNWEATLTVPMTGTEAMISATVGGNGIGSSMVTLKTLAVKPAGGGGSSGGSTDSGGGGGCALAGGSQEGLWLLLLVMAAALLGLRRRARE